MIPLGPVQLESRIGAGGMAQVWRGVHPELGVPVAVKVLHEAALRTPGFHAAFRNEIRAVAGLNHPNIVVVYDLGEVDEEAEIESEGILPRGVPWLAMELLEGGDLRPQRGRLDWPACMAILEQILAALAHAHARGVIHLDLKPGNVLVGDDSAPRLSDFGIAHVVTEVDGADAAVPAGTPAYMAPEQFRTDWRSYGPWTDLYALGSLAWSLVCGRTPYRIRGWWDGLAQHGRRPLPRLEPAIPVPADLEQWLAGLLEKRACDRYQRAADALCDLRALRRAPGGRRLPRKVDPEADTFLYPSKGEPTLSSAPHPSDVVVPPEPGPGVPAPAVTENERARRPTPTLPRRWSTGAAEAPPPAGLSLYGLRDIPLVGRVAERDALWGALSAVHVERTARAVVLRGTAGYGKSSLASWLSRRADEVGGAIALRAVHSAPTAPSHGVAAALARYLGCYGLEPEPMRTRLDAWLGVRGAVASTLGDALVAALHSGEVQGGRAFSSDAERWTLLHRILAVLGEERPVILWLDDVHHSRDALGFARHVLSEGTATAPLLLLLTARDDLLGEAEVELDALCAAPAVDTCTIGPLSEQEGLQLLGQRVGLDPMLAHRLQRRTAGNPLFVVHLLDDWVQRGLLQPATSGLRLRPGARLGLPDRVHDVWTSRTEQLLAGHPPSWRTALYAAALLGVDVDAEEWSDVCARAGCEAPDELVDALLAARLAVQPDRAVQGFAFVHTMYRESVARSAREEGTAAHLHRCCAQVLERRDGSAARVARHLVEAGDLEAALEPLLAGVREQFTRSDFLGAEQLIEERERVCDELGLPETDPRAGWNVWARAQAARYMGRFDASRALSQALARTELPGFEELRRLGMLVEAQTLLHEGLVADALVCADLAIEALERSPDAIARANAELAAGIALHVLGRYDEARARLEPAYARFADLGYHGGKSDCSRVLGMVAFQTGKLGLARTLFRRALDEIGRTGSPLGTALCISGLADVLRATGDLAGAEARYREAHGVLAAMWSAQASLVELSIGFTLVLQDELDRGSEVLTRCRDAVRTQERWFAVAVADAWLLLVDARRGHWSAFDARLDALAANLARTGAVEVDIARPAEDAAAAAEEAGEDARAEAARAIADAQWERLGSRGP